MPGSTSPRLSWSQFLDQVPYRRRVHRHAAPAVPVPATLPAGRSAARASTQEAFGRIMGELGRADGELARHLVTTSPDVTVSTNLGPWVTRRGVFNRREHDDVFKSEAVASPTVWRESQQGQHLELGIAENNLFLNLASLGLAHELFGARLLPVGTLYDPFINRGLDALIYACYQGARFLLVATPSGITPGARGRRAPVDRHPADRPVAAGPDQLRARLRRRAGRRHALGASSICRHRTVAPVYLRLSTRQIDQPERAAVPEGVIEGGYWLQPPGPGAELALVFSGAVAPEVLAAAAAMADDIPGLGILAVTSADRLHAGWTA